MARLVGEESLTLEVNILGIRIGWVEYEILLLWQGKPIINDDVLRHENLHWPVRTPGALVASQHCDDRDLALTIKAAMETGKRSYWQPLTDPSVSIATRRTVAYSGEFELIISVDTNAFVGCGYYTGDEISLTMNVARESLADFCEQLKKERGELVCA